MIALTPSGERYTEANDSSLPDRVASALWERTPRIAQDRRRYGHLMLTGTEEPGSTTLHVDDASAIACLDRIAGLEFYPGRAFTRAGQGDLVACPYPQTPGYLTYLSETLRLGRPAYLEVEDRLSGKLPQIFRSILEDPSLLQTLKNQVLHGLSRIHPYMGHEAAWTLAEKLNVQVVGPLPSLTDSCNDKNWFADCVRMTLGAEAAVQSSAGHSAQDICEKVLREARRSSSVAMRLANSASGMGTSVFSSPEILNSGRARLLSTIETWLKEHSWKQGESPPISVERWEESVAGSPSVQLWIPPQGTGLPLLEGVFDQIFVDNRPNVFLGSVPSRLPASVRKKIGDRGLLLGRVFQLLGYVGRCSFDTILAGSDLLESTVIFVECNGRWGGTSTPMTLMNRLFGDYRSKNYAARDLMLPSLEGCTFPRLVEAVREVLFEERTQEGWAILYNVGCLRPIGKFDVITLGRTHAEAEDRQHLFEELVAQRL